MTTKTKEISQEVARELLEACKRVLLRMPEDETWQKTICDILNNVISKAEKGE